MPSTQDTLVHLPNPEQGLKANTGVGSVFANGMSDVDHLRVIVQDARVVHIAQPRHKDVIRTARIMPGKTQITEVARPKATPTLITLVPISPTGTSGDAIRFVCGHNAIACTRQKPPAAAGR
jgi:hypothetical protein